MASLYRVITAGLVIAFLTGCSADNAPVQEVMIIAVELEGSPLQVAEWVRVDRILSLDEGNSLRFADKSGQIHRISGPFNNTIASSYSISETTEAGEQMLLRAKQYLQLRPDLQLVQGATRSGLGKLAWALVLNGVAEGDLHCIPEDGQFALIRDTTQTSSETAVTLSSERTRPMKYWFADGSSSTQVNSQNIWDADYSITLHDEQLATVTFKKVGNPENSRIALTLYEAGCAQQFERYFKFAFLE